MPAPATVHVEVVSAAVITGDASPQIRAQAQALFRAYGDFLRHSQGHLDFCYDRLDQEIRDLPAPYSTHQGAVLAAVAEAEDAAPQVAGVIAYRAHPAAPSLHAFPHACEIKRLFVHPDFRGRGIGALLVAEVLVRAARHGYQTACLDTEPRVMASAYHTYLKAGFTEYQRQSSPSGVDLLYLQKTLA